MIVPKPNSLIKVLSASMAAAIYYLEHTINVQFYMTIILNYIAFIDRQLKRITIHAKHFYLLPDF